MVLGDAALRDELLAAPDLPALMALVRERGRERGVEISEEELQRRGEHQPPVLGGTVDRPMSRLRFDGWVPFRLYWQGSEPGVEWFYLGARRFSEPFFEGTAHFEVQTPFNSLFRFRTPIGALAEWHERESRD